MAFDSSGFFSVAFWRELERDKDEARREPFARMERVLARIIHERRVREAQAALGQAEREAARDSEAGRPGEAATSALVETLKQQLERLLREDGPALIAASDVVAGAIEGEADSPQPPVVSPKTSGHAPEPVGKTNGKARSPIG